MAPHRKEVAEATKKDADREYKKYRKEFRFPGNITRSACTRRDQFELSPTEIPNYKSDREEWAFCANLLTVIMNNGCVIRNNGTLPIDQNKKDYYTIISYSFDHEKYTGGIKVAFQVRTPTGQRATISGDFLRQVMTELVEQGKDGVAVVRHGVDMKFETSEY